MESCSRTLERDAVCRWPEGVETRVELSTLRLPASISRCSASDVLRELLVLAVFLRSAGAVVVSGGLGGARGGGGGARVGVGGAASSSGIVVVFLRSTSSRA